MQLLLHNSYPVLFSKETDSNLYPYFVALIVNITTIFNKYSDVSVLVNFVNCIAAFFKAECVS